MPTSPDSTDLSAWHTYFGAASNNEAWTLAEKATLWPEEIDALLNHAHGAALHWSAVGTPVNQNRARLLLALAHCRWRTAARGTPLRPNAWPRWCEHSLRCTKRRIGSKPFRRR